MSFCFIYSVVLENDSVQISPGGRGSISNSRFITVPRPYFFCGYFMFFFCLVFVMSFVRVRLFVPCGKLLGKG